MKEPAISQENEICFHIMADLPPTMALHSGGLKTALPSTVSRTFGLMAWPVGPKNKLQIEGETHGHACKFHSSAHVKT